MDICQIKQYNAACMELEVFVVYNVGRLVNYVIFDEYAHIVT
jgi:hypothetical protein